MAIEWYDSDDVLISAAFTLSAPAGTPGTAVQLDLWNNRTGTGADTLTEVLLQVLAEVTNPDTLTEEWRSEGVEVLDNHEVEARIVSGLNQTLLASDWTPLGTHRLLPIPDIPNDAGVRLEVRLNPTSDSASDAVRIAFRVHSRSYTVTSVGLTESTTDGVLSGTGDGGIREILSFDGGVVENPAGADDQVEIGDLLWLGSGIPWCLLSHLVQIDANDGNSEALQSGEGYYAALSLADDGTITQTKGLRSATPVKPTAPTDEILIAWVLREFDALIDNADIEEVWEEWGFNHTESGTTLTLSPGHARIDNRLLRLTGTRSVTLAVSDTSKVYLLADGSLQATVDGSRPTARALLLYEATTDATTVTAITDHRVWIGGRVHLLEIPVSRSGGLQVGDAGHSVWPYPVAGYLRHESPVILSLDDMGNTPTAGQTQVDALLSDAGAAFAIPGTSLYPDSASDDRRPAVAWDASDPVDRDSLPTVREIPAWSRLRAEVTEIPTATAAPESLRVFLVVEAP